MYAIMFKLDSHTLNVLYPSENWQNAYKDIKNVLEPFGFQQQQESVYFGNADVDVVKCVLAMQKLSHSYAWFKPAILDMKMLRIAESDDLLQAI